MTAHINVRESLLESAQCVSGKKKHFSFINLLPSG
jgi:hypothetical protein